MEGERTKLRMGLTLPGDNDLAAVAFLHCGPSDQALSPQGAPAGKKSCAKLRMGEKCLVGQETVLINKLLPAQVGSMHAG